MAPEIEDPEEPGWGQLEVGTIQLEVGTIQYSLGRYNTV